MLWEAPLKKGEVFRQIIWMVLNYHCVVRSKIKFRLQSQKLSGRPITCNTQVIHLEPVFCCQYARKSLFILNTPAHRLRVANHNNAATVTPIAVSFLGWRRLPEPSAIKCENGRKF